jgi:hypothetical protein
MSDVPNTAPDSWLASLVCPVSAERGRQDVVRVTAFLVATLAIAYLVAPNVWIPALLLVDFAARGAGRRAWSPLARVAQAVAARAHASSPSIDLAPKQFAARVGFLLSLAILALHPLAPTAALALAGILAAFALLESLGNVCVGCLMYTHLVFPIVRRR